MNISSTFFEVAAIFVSMGAFYMFGYQLGYNHGLKDGIRAALDACDTMKGIILQLAFGESNEQEEDTETK